MKLSFKALAAVVFASAAINLSGCGTDSASLPPQPNLSPAPKLFTVSASGNIQTAVDNFRTSLGGTNNVAGGTVTGGRREINWDAVPGAVTNTSTFPGDFFNTNSTRGSIFTTTGTGFRVAGDNFASVNATYATLFNVFSAPKSFAPVNSTIVDVIFNVPGTGEPAAVPGFAAVFSDVNAATSSKIEFFDVDGELIGSVAAPVRSDATGLSFAGATVANGRLAARVRLTVGSAPLGPTTADVSQGGTADLVVVDDFIYGEPVAIPRRVIKGSGDVAGVVNAFRAALGAPNNGAGAAAATGRREVNWDAVPANVTNTNNFPATFFNTNSTRGVVFSTNGTGFRVSDQNFADVDPSYGNNFRFFSAIKSFAAIGSNLYDNTFFLSGTNTAATVAGFGAVFSDVDVAGASNLQFFNAGGNGLGTFNAPLRSDPVGLSFVGVHFASSSPAGRVRLQLGTRGLGAGIKDIKNGGVDDLVVIDDILYSEPK